MRIKMMTFFCVGALALTFADCKKSTDLTAVAGQETNSASNSSKLQVNSVTDHVIETGMTLAQINAVIAGASAGQTVYVQAGTYAITGRINFKAGVSIVKQSSTNPIFDGTSASAIQTFYYTTDMSNATLSGITFWNIRIEITGGVKSTIKWCLFDYGKRAANTNKTNNLNDDYIRLNSTDSAQVSNCVFSHRSTDPGRGVWTGSGSTNTKILNNTFGNGGTTGYFVCAINDNSQSNSLIDSNILNRNSALNSADSLTDHAIYAHSFNGLTISNNTVSGWPATGSGGVKVRNGQHATISGNTINDSGILLYEYVNTPAYPYLNYVVVSGNTINISAPANDMYHGIGYYRDNTTDSEYSIRIDSNSLPNGTILANSSNINVTNFNAASGGVYNNDTAAGYLLLKTGIANSGNY